jgi:outer membrane biosynthesis protein TonB
MHIYWFTVLYVKVKVIISAKEVLYRPAFICREK